MGIAKKHLSEAERKNIARDLFKVTSTEEKKGELHGLCPIHQESNPSFSYNYQKDSYNCFSCGASGDLLKLWCEVNGHGQKEGFKAFCEKFALPSGGDQKQRGAAAKGAGGDEADLVSHEKAVEQMHFAWEKFPALPDARIERLEKTRGWSRKWIEILDLRLETYRMKKNGDLIKLKTPEKIAIPVRDSQGNLINIRLYHEGAKQYKIISFGRSTGSSRLFPSIPLDDHFLDKKRPARIDQNVISLPIAGNASFKSVIVLCEGESDTICALSHGFNAITQTSKLKNWPDNHLTPFRDRDVVITYDADEAGQKYAGFAAQALMGTAKTIRMIQWPSFMGVDESGAIPANHGQDLTDFFVRHKKTAEDFQKLIDSAKSPDASAPAPLSSDSQGNVVDIREFYSFGTNNRFSFRPRLLAEKIISETPLLSDPETGLIYCWNGRYWEIYNEDHLRKKAIMYLGSESQRDRIQDAIFQVRMLSTIPAGRKTNDKIDWICIQNGMLNLNSIGEDKIEIIPHDKEFYFTDCLDVSLEPDSDRRCERWEQFLLQTVQTPEPIAQLQEFFGYCFVRHTKHEKCLFLLGPGEDGKSKFLGVMKEILGDQNCSAVSFPDLENEFHRSSIFNKLLNISTEIGAQAIESPYFKAITSGDPINAAYKHQDNFTFSPYVKLAFAGNRLPRVRDNSHGYFRRFLPVQFKRQFLVGDPDRDPDLMDKLRKEKSEIFFWALCGLKRLNDQKRFTDSDETRSLMMGYRRSNNPILCYVEDECVLGEDKEVAKKDIYMDYERYCKEGGYDKMNRENFFRELYTAVSHLKLYRPRVDGGRQSKIKGISIGGVFNDNKD